MLSSLVLLVLTNLEWAALLAIIVFGMGRLSSFQKRPPLMHLLWFDVLLRLIVPPVVAHAPDLCQLNSQQAIDRH